MKQDTYGQEESRAPTQLQKTSKRLGWAQVLPRLAIVNGHSKHVVRHSHRAHEEQNC